MCNNLQLIIETELLDLEKEYNIHKVLKHNWDTLSCFFILVVFLAIGYQSPIMLAPILLLLMLYVVMDDNYEQVSQRNDIKINHALKQNAYFELVQANAQDMMDIMEKEKEVRDKYDKMNNEYIDYVNSKKLQPQ